MAVLTSQVQGDSITVDVERTPVDLPAVLPTTPIEDGLPATRSRYAGPVSVQITILLARVPGIGDDDDTIIRWLDRVSSRAERVTYTIDDDDYRDLMVGPRSIERDPQTTSLRISLLLQQVAAIGRGTSTAAFPDAAADARSGTEGTEDGGQQSGEEVEPPRGSISSAALPSLR